MGSLFSSVTAPRVLLLGASGGDFCIFFAHLANTILNWENMHFINRIISLLLGWLQNY